MADIDEETQTSEEAPQTAERMWPAKRRRLNRDKQMQDVLDTQLAKKGKERTFANSELITLDDPDTGQLVLEKLCKLMRDGHLLDTCVRTLRIDRENLERLRRDRSPWGKHVNNSINMATAEFERKVIVKLLDSESQVDIKKAQVYIDSFQPSFTKGQKLTLDYNVNYMLEAVRRHVDEDTFIAILEELVSQLDVRILMDTLDSALLPKEG